MRTVEYVPDDYRESDGALEEAAGEAVYVIDEDGEVVELTIPDDVEDEAQEEPSHAQYD